ncbi:MAG: glycosyltransferase [Paracoccaceae bacterium]
MPRGNHKILHVHFGKEGGAERFFVALAQAFERHGVEQQFIVRPNQSWTPTIKAIGEVTPGNFSHWMAATGILQWKMRQICRNWQPDAILAWMPRASRLLPPKTDAVRLTRLGDFPTSLKYFTNTDVVVGNLPAIGTHVQSLGWTGAVATVSNFPRPITPKPVSRAAHDTSDDVFLAVAGGRFVTRKGMDIAIRATAKTPGAWLWLLGTGPEEEALRNLAAELNVADRVKFIGWVDEAIHYIAAGDAFIMPSRHEPLGNMLLEAWRAGVPSVSTRSEGPDWYMRDGVDGIVTEIDDVDAVAAGLAEIRDNPEKAALFAHNASDRLDEMFSEKAVVEGYLTLIKEHAKGPK